MYGCEQKAVKPEFTLRINDTTIQQVKKFNYLGSIQTEDRKCDTKIKRRIGMAKGAFQKLEKMLKDRRMSMDTKNRVVNCYVISILTYGCDCWMSSNQMEERLKAAAMLFKRRMLRISWMEHIANEEVLRRSGEGRSLMKNIRKRQLEFMGHIMRKDRLENLTLTVRIEGK